MSCSKLCAFSAAIVLVVTVVLVPLLTKFAVKDKTEVIDLDSTTTEISTTEIETTVAQIATTIITPMSTTTTKNPCDNHTCNNGGKCVTSYDERVYKCLCILPWTGRFCEQIDKNFI